MKIAHPSSKKRWLLVCIAVLVIAGVGIGVYALRQSQETTKKSSVTSTSQSGTSAVSLNPPTDEEVKAGQDAKAQTVNPDSSSAPNDGQSNGLSALANYTGTSVQVRTTFSTSIADGTCSLTLTKGSTVVTRPTVGIQPLSGYSTCKGWDIPVAELSSGTWAAKVTASYQSKTSVATAVVNVP